MLFGAKRIIFRLERFLLDFAYEVDYNDFVVLELFSRAVTTRKELWTTSSRVFLLPVASLPTYFCVIESLLARKSCEIVENIGLA